jgi:hypothetical protein
MAYFVKFVYFVLTSKKTRRVNEPRTLPLSPRYQGVNKVRLTFYPTPELSIACDRFQPLKFVRWGYKPGVDGRSLRLKGSLTDFIVWAGTDLNCRHEDFQS